MQLSQEVTDALTGLPDAEGDQRTVVLLLRKDASSPEPTAEQGNSYAGVICDAVEGLGYDLSQSYLVTDNLDVTESVLGDEAAGLLSDLKASLQTA